MSKNDLVLHLKAYGEDPPRAWTKVELRQRLYDLAAAGEVQLVKGGKTKTPYLEAVAAVNRASSKKANLVNYIQDTLKLSVNPNDTIAILQKKALTHLQETIPGTGEDTMGFGKYANKTYQQVYQDDPSYVQWCRTTAQEGPCSIYLDRFVNWVSKIPENDRKIKGPMVVGPKSSKDMPKDPKTTQDETKTTEKKGRPLDSASSSSDQAVGHLAEMVKELMKEVKDLKEDRAMSAPRKMAAKSDETM